MWKIPYLWLYKTYICIREKTKLARDLRRLPSSRLSRVFRGRPRFRFTSGIAGIMGGPCLFEPDADECGRSVDSTSTKSLSGVLDRLSCKQKWHQKTIFFRLNGNLRVDRPFRHHPMCHPFRPPSSLVPAPKWYYFLNARNDHQTEKCDIS